MGRKSVKRKDGRAGKNLHLGAVGKDTTSPIVEQNGGGQGRRRTSFCRTYLETKQKRGEGKDSSRHRAEENSRLVGWAQKRVGSPYAKNPAPREGDAEQGKPHPFIFPGVKRRNQGT